MSPKPLTERNDAACVLLEKWGIDPSKVSAYDVTSSGYYLLADEVDASLIPHLRTGRTGRRIFHTWPEDFPLDDFFATLPIHVRERNAA